MRAKRIEIVLPVFNERPNIVPLLQALDAATAKLRGRYEFSYLFVNDGSTDGTRELIDCLCAERPHMRAVHLIHNFGHSAAINCGLANANADAVVLMDADLQDSPGALPEMIAAWEDGSKTVVAVRGKRQERNRWMFHAFHWLLSRLAPGQATFGTYCLLDRSVVARLLTLPEHNSYFPNLVQFASESIATVQVDRNARQHGNSRVGQRGLWNLAITAILNASNLPVRLASLMGLAWTLTSAVVSMLIATLWLLTNTAIPVWAPMLTAIFFAGGVQLLCLGIMGEYIHRMYAEIKQRPAYFVESHVRAQQHHEIAA